MVSQHNMQPNTPSTRMFMEHNKLSKPKLRMGTGMSGPTLVLCSGTLFYCLRNAMHAVRYLCHSRPLVWFSIPAVLHDLDQLHAHTLHSQHHEADTYVTRLQSARQGEIISHIGKHRTITRMT